MSEIDTKKEIYKSYLDGIPAGRRSAGEKLLKGGSLVYCEIRKDGGLDGLFRDLGSKKIIETRLPLSGKSLKAECSCGSPSCCAHVPALLIHGLRFISDESDIKKSAGMPEYGALVHRGKDKLLSEKAQGSSLRILIEGDLPHLPSRWAQMKFCVEIFSKGKIYKGNIGNLRQLHNRGSIGGLLDHSEFSLQEKQIIRYLSFNSEYEETKLVLNSEKASDFFHCLCGYQNVFCNDKSLSFYNVPVLPGITIKNLRGTKKILPVLRTNFAIFALENARVVIGQNGLWVGIGTNYFWLPATRDVKWLRDFIRYSSATENTDTDSEIERFKTLGIEFISSDKIAKSLNLSFDKAKLIAKFANRGLELELFFEYAGVGVFPADFHSTGISGGKILQRDTERELSIENRLLFVGFKKIDSSGKYFTDSPELIGKFFEKLRLDWALDMEVFVDAGICGKGVFKNGIISEIEFKCELLEEGLDSYLLSCEFRSGGGKIPLKSILKAIDAGENYISGTEDEAPSRIGTELAGFVNRLRALFNEIDSEGKIRLSRIEALAWEKASKDFPPARVAKFASLAQSIFDSRIQLEHFNEFTGELRPYQIEGVQWILSRFFNKLNCILADEMGLGKTIQTIAMLLEMRGRVNGFKSLIICPSSLTENWAHEIAKFAPSLKTGVLTGTERMKFFEGEENKTEVFITSYSTFKRDLEFHLKFRYSVVVLDEAQHIKNPDTGNAISCKKLSTEHKIVLTGTPVENQIEELISIMDFLHPEMISGINSRIREKNSEGIRLLEDELVLRISPIILRRRKADVLPQLPPKEEQLLLCTMDETQSEKYSELFAKSREEFSKLLKSSNKAGVKFQMLTLLLRLRQFCCHPQLLPNEYGCKEIASGKTELLKELILESVDSGQKVLVFSQFPSFLRIVNDWLENNRIIYEYLDGKTQDRLERVKRFNGDKDCFVFLLSIKVGGFGLNLSSAERVIIYDPWWNPAVEMQATDRAHRIGQTRKVNVQKLILKDSVEEKILLLQERKKRLFDKVVESAPSTMRDISIDDMKILFGVQ